MATPDRERKLRQVVGALSRCAIDDIEFIWGALSATERARLQPVLAAAAHVGADAFTALGTQASRTTAGTRDDHRIPHLAYLCAELPEALSDRIVSCLDPTMRIELIAHVSATPKALAWRADRTYPITERACTALREAALAIADTVSLPLPPRKERRPRFWRRWRSRP